MVLLQSLGLPAFLLLIKAQRKVRGHFARASYKYAEASNLLNPWKWDLTLKSLKEVRKTVQTLHK
jgi:hypothetical protein